MNKPMTKLQFPNFTNQTINNQLPKLKPNNQTISAANNDNARDALSAMDDNIFFNSIDSESSSLISST